MSKHLPTILAAAALFVALTGPTVHALSTRLGDLSNTTVSCVAGGSAEVIEPGSGAASSICVSNPSSTCVSLGGSTIAHPAGIEVGDGCRDGFTFCADTRRMWCDPDAGTVVVEVVWGVQ